MFKGIWGNEVADEAREMMEVKSLQALSCRKSFGCILCTMRSQWRALTSLAAMWKTDIREARVEGKSVGKLFYEPRREMILP